MRRGPPRPLPPNAGVVIGLLVIVGLALFIGFVLQRGGIGTGHALGFALIGLGGVAVAYLKGRR